jgi:hypothetical protein
VQWGDFAEAAPDLAAVGAERFRRYGVILLGTIRRDGTPRISPVEPYVVDGRLLLGMMWQSHKARDLQRDPRCLVHSAVANRDGKEGEFKVRGRAEEIHNEHWRTRYGDATEATIDWRPSGDWHLFAIEIESVAWVRYGDGAGRTTRWTPDGGVVETERAG